jgi:hypothetical protein
MNTSFAPNLQFVQARSDGANGVFLIAAFTIMPQPACSPPHPHLSLESHKWFEINRLLPPRPQDSSAEPKPARFHRGCVRLEYRRLELAATELWLRSLADAHARSLKKLLIMEVSPAAPVHTKTLAPDLRLVVQNDIQQ